MKMSKEDYRIYSVAADGKMFVVANMGTLGWDWPETILDEKTGKSFTFVSNEPMQDWMSGKFGGHARYEAVQ